MSKANQNTKDKGISERLNELSGIVVDAALQVHRELGAGLLESVYEVCLCEELRSRGIHVDRQIQLPIHYRGKELDAGLRIDLLIEGSLIIELKSVEALLPLHQAQVLTYLKLTDRHLGLLINFNVQLIRDGIHRLIR